MMVGDIHVNIPHREDTKRLRRKCFTCAKRTRHVAENYGVYGWTLRCCACGDSWQETSEGWWLTPRPFERGWRTRAIATAEKAYKEATP